MSIRRPADGQTAKWSVSADRCSGDMEGEAFGKRLFGLRNSKEQSGVDLDLAHVGIVQR
jgi:hypothetical protein